MAWNLEQKALRGGPRGALTIPTSPRELGSPSKALSSPTLGPAYLHHPSPQGQDSPREVPSELLQVSLVEMPTLS